MFSFFQFFINKELIKTDSARVHPTKETESIINGLTNILKSEYCSILVINGHSIAIKRQNFRFWSFIPHTVSKYNSFLSIENMVNHFINDFIQNEMDVKIFKVKITENLDYLNDRFRNMFPSEEVKEYEEIFKPQTFYIPLEELRAVQEYKNKKRRYRTKRNKSGRTNNCESKQRCESESSSKSVSECSTECKEIAEEKECCLKNCEETTTTSDDFVPEVPNINLQEYSEGEDSGYVEVT